MQRLAQCLERGFLHRFAQGGVGVDGVGHILQARAHFQGLGKGGDQFGHALADGLPAQDEVVALAGHDAHEAAGQRPGMLERLELALDEQDLEIGDVEAEDDAVDGERGAGILMPIFSLPSPYGIGTFEQRI